MKKFLAVLLAAMLVFAFGVNAMAESSEAETTEVETTEESFVQSPKPDDDIILVDAELPAAMTELFVTSFKNKANLTAEQQAVFETAYNVLSGAEDLSAVIANIGETLGVPSDAIAVGTMFFAHIVQMSRIASTGDYVIEVKCAGLDKFAGLINYSNNQWSVIESAVINERGNLVFTTSNLDVFAVLLDVSEETTSDDSIVTPDSSDDSNTDAPSTGDSFPWIVVILAAVAVVGIIVIAVTGKKKR